MSKLEKDYQAHIKRMIQILLPGCIVLKNDADHFQGIPDLIIIYGKLWAALEVKRNQNAKHQPNQDYYIDKLSKMGFASFIYPENENEVIEKLIYYLRCQK